MKYPHVQTCQKPTGFRRVPQYFKTLTLTLMPLFVWLMLEMDEGGAWLEFGVDLGSWGESRRLSCDLRTSDDRLHSRSVPPLPPPPLSRSLSVSLPTRPKPRPPRPTSEPFRDPATCPSSPMPESVWGRPARGESSTGVGVCLSRSEKAVDGCSVMMRKKEIKFYFVYLTCTYVYGQI